MLLSSSGAEAGLIPLETRRIASLLARQKTGSILSHLHRRPFLAASEIARLETIHVATAQRYLKELVEAGLLGSRLRAGGARPTEEYWLLDPHITISIDLERAAVPPQPELADMARRVFVRGLGPANVVYDTNPRTGDVDGLLILSGSEPRLVAERIRLPLAVGRFLAHLPAGARMTVWDVMQRAGLGADHLPELLSALGRLCPRPVDGTDPVATAPGSARPFDPLTARLFAALSPQADRLLAAIPRHPLVELSPPEPPEGAA